MLKIEDNSMSDFSFFFITMLTSLSIGFTCLTGFINIIELESRYINTLNPSFGVISK